MKQITLIAVAFFCLALSARSEFLNLRIEPLKTNASIKLESITAFFIEKDYVMIVSDGHYFELRPVREVVNLSLVGACLEKDHRHILYDQVLERLTTAELSEAATRKRISELEKGYDRVKGGLSSLIKSFEEGEELGFEARLPLAVAYEFLISLEGRSIKLEGFRKLDR